MKTDEQILDRFLEILETACSNESVEHGLGVGDCGHIDGHFDTDTLVSELRKWLEGSEDGEKGAGNAPMPNAFGKSVGSNAVTGDMETVLTRSSMDSKEG